MLMQKVFCLYFFIVAAEEPVQSNICDSRDDLCLIQTSRIQISKSLRLSEENEDHLYLGADGFSSDDHHAKGISDDQRAAVEKVDHIEVKNAEEELVTLSSDTAVRQFN